MLDIGDETQAAVLAGRDLVVCLLEIKTQTCFILNVLTSVDLGHIQGKMTWRQLNVYKSGTQGRSSTGCQL